MHDQFFFSLCSKQFLWNGAVWQSLADVYAMCISLMHFHKTMATWKFLHEFSAHFSQYERGRFNNAVFLNMCVCFYHTTPLINKQPSELLRRGVGESISVDAQRRHVDGKDTTRCWGWRGSAVTLMKEGPDFCSHWERRRGNFCSLASPETFTSIWT